MHPSMVRFANRFAGRGRKLKWLHSSYSFLIRQMSYQPIGNCSQFRLLLEFARTKSNYVVSFINSFVIVVSLSAVVFLNIGIVVKSLTWLL